MVAPLCGGTLQLDSLTKASLLVESKEERLATK